MAVNTDQLADDYNEIQDRFSHSPYIKIISIEGDPPNSYQIEYKVKGLTKNKAGQVEETESHQVEITLPFGYPHFPPNCKPLTSIFHPDIDPDAVRIGDYWAKSHSLPDLIIHIGNLICFAQYSSEDVFNNDALEWAKSNSDKLPLQKIDFSLKEQASESAVDDDQNSSISLETDNDKKAEMPQADIPEPGSGTHPPQESQYRKNSSSLFKILGTGVILISIATGILLYLDIRHHDKAEQNWKKVGLLVRQNEYTEANRLVKETQKSLESIKFLKKSEKQALLQKITTLVNSEKYRHGIQGKILVDGLYLTAKELQTVKELSDLLSQGEKLADTARWEDAAEAFEKAATKADELGENSPMSKTDINELSTRSHIISQIETGNSLRSRGKWKQAIAIYETALQKLAEVKKLEQNSRSTTKDASTSILNKTEKFLERARSGTGALGITQDDIRQKITQISNELQELLMLADKFSKDAKWQEAADIYGKVVQKAIELDELSPVSANNVQNLLNQSLVQVQLETGNTLREQKKWQEAIKSYQVALEQLTGISNGQGMAGNMLDKSAAFLAESRAETSALGVTQTEISRKILSASIEREEYRVKSFLQQEEYGRAVKALGNIVSLINKSPFATEKKFATVKQSALSRIEENKFLHEIQEKALYLFTNYQQIFKEKFDSAATSELSDPQVDFYKSHGNMLIFKMQCQEKIRRQKYTLEMYYQFNTVSQSWSVYK